MLLTSFEAPFFFNRLCGKSILNIIMIIAEYFTYFCFYFFTWGCA